MQSNLKTLFSGYGREDRIFANRDALSHNYTPDSLIHRDSQIKQLADILAPSLNGNKVSNCFLFGKTGTGKTLVTNHITKELQKTNKNIKALYINCKMRGIADTEYRIIAEITRELGKEVPVTGLPTSEVYRLFYKAVENQNKTIILVLDEIDALVEKTGDNILYNLTRINQNLPNARLSLIGISNSTIFTETLDPRVKSTLSEEEIIFAPYNASQIKDILKERAKQAFKKGVLKPGVIEKCAALAAQEHGDARKALDLLRISAELAERRGKRTTTIEDVDKAEGKLDQDRTVEIIKTQPKQSLAILATIMKMSEKKESIQTGEVYSIYKEICRKAGLKTLTQRRISDLIAELDMLGIINSQIVSKGRHGRSREIKLQLSKPVLDKTREVLTSNYML